MTLRSITTVLVLITLAFIPRVSSAADPWVVMNGLDGPGKGKNVVLVSGDEEYRSEETLPQLAKILAKHHGFDCTVLFAIDPATGTINPDRNNNIPGLEALDKADLLIIFTRFRDLPDDQMKHVVDYVNAGKPVIGLRTATHAFKLNARSSYVQFTNDSKTWDGGFGRQVLGETWITHHGPNATTSTRAIVADAAKEHPILRGIKSGEIWGPTGVYAVRLPLPDCQPLLLGQVVNGTRATDPPMVGAKNDPMMPIAWTHTYASPVVGDREKTRHTRTFTTTMGASQDFENAGLRRVLVNATYWVFGLEEKITPELKVDLVGDFKPTRYGTRVFKKDVKPSDLAMKPGE